MTRLRLRQMLFVMRLELQRYVRGRRYLGIYVLAIIPNLLLWATRSMVQAYPEMSGYALLRAYPIAYAQMFGSFQLRLLIFFSCGLIFSQLFRSEILEKTLHYYFTIPIRREVVVVGKYLTALVVSLSLFVSTTILSYYLFF